MRGARKEEALPERLGTYRVHRVLGSGGMGIVYEGEAPDGGVVAIKALRSEKASDDQVDRFLREATIRLDHPNVIRVLDAGRDAVDDTPYLVMERLSGESLEDALRRGPLPAPRVAAIGIAAARGLEAVHAAGVLHRDIKPANLFLCEDGAIKVLDFGIALVDAPDRMTREGMLVGTPSYLSPEQARGERAVDERADLWAVGVVMYEALGGRAPFDRESMVSTLVAILFDEPEPLDLPDLPVGLVRVLDRCLQKAPGRRFASAPELASALGAVDHDELMAAATMPPSAASARPKHGSSVSLPVDEQRVVSVLLAADVTDERALARIVTAHGGQALPLLGRSLLGLFGVDAWHGDEIERAVAAGLEGRGLAGRVGVGSGRAMGGDGGPVSGEAIVAAERAAATLLEGVGLARDSVPAVARSVVARDVAADPRIVEVVEIHAQRPETLAPSQAAADTPLFGREDALDALDAAWRRALATARPHLVVIEGDRGVGKTRLREAFHERLALDGTAGTTLGARATPGRAARLLAVLGDVIRHDVASIRPDDGLGEGLRARARDLLGEVGAETCVSALGELLGTKVDETLTSIAARADPQLMSDLVRLATEDYLSAVVRTGPALLVIEDAQFADESSLELLARLSSSAGDAPWLTLVLTRPEAAESVVQALTDPPGWAEVVRMPLAGLAPDDAKSLARSASSVPLDDALLDGIVERADGNPLFVEQMVLALDDAYASSAGRGAELPLPITVEAAVQARLQRLSPAAREIVKRASVYGRDFTSDELVALGVDDPAEALLELVGGTVLDAVPSRRSNERLYRFRSRLALDVAYRMLTAHRRIDLHRLAAKRLSEHPTPDYEEVASHFDRGGARHEAARWYARAVVEAAGRGDSRGVLDNGERAMELGLPDDLAFEVHLARSDALRFLGRRDEQSEALTAALPLARDDRDRALALDAYAAWLLRLGRTAEAVAAAAAAERAADATGDPERRALAQGRLAEAFTAAERFDEAEARLDDAAAALGEVPAPHARAFLAGRRSHLAGALGDVGGAQRARREAAEWFERAGNLRSAAANQVNLADALNRLGRYVEAAAELRRGLEGCRRVGNHVAEAYGRANLAYSLLHQGHVDEGFRELDVVDAAATRTKDARLSAFARLYRARGLLSAGRVDEAREVAEPLVDMARRGGMADVEALACAVAARAALALGDVEGALGLAERADSERERLGGIEEDEAEIFLALAAALRASGRAADADRVIARGRGRLEEVASRIRDPQLRRAFLELVPFNRAVLRA